MLFATLGEHSRSACRRDSIAYFKLPLNSCSLSELGGGECGQGHVEDELTSIRSRYHWLYLRLS
jgi:hypothetical protein